MRGLKKWAVNVGLLCLSVVAVILLGEAILRLTPYKHLLTRDHLLRNYYRSDPVKGFDIRPNVPPILTAVDQQRVEFSIWSNELCCFDEPYRGEPDVILLLGDSFTHSYAPFPDKWGTRIERLLGYRVLKCGVSGYGTQQELLKAQEIIARIRRNPRLIIVGYFWNDSFDDFSFPNLTVVDGFLVNSAKYQDWIKARNFGDLDREFSFWEKLSPRYPLSFTDLTWYFCSQHLITLNLVSKAMMTLFPARSAYADPAKFVPFHHDDGAEVIWQTNAENLKRFREFAAAHQARLLMVIIPANTQVYPFLVPPPGLDLERPNRLLGRFFQEEHIDYLDLLPLFRKYADQTPRPHLSSDKDLYWRYNSHWSIKGEHLAGLLVSRYILEHHLVQVADGERKLKEIQAQLASWR